MCFIFLLREDTPEGRGVMKSPFRGCVIFSAVQSKRLKRQRSSAHKLGTVILSSAPRFQTGRDWPAFDLALGAGSDLD
jgi:hypothetical protein